MPSLTPIKIYRGIPVDILMPSGIPDNSFISSVPAVYTVGAGKRVIIKSIRVTTLDDETSARIYVKTGVTNTTSNGDYVLFNCEVQASDTFLFESNEVLEAGESIYVWIDQLAPAAVQISGIEVTL